MIELREKRGLAYSVGSYLYPYEKAALMVGHVATKNARVNESIDLIRKEIGRLRETGPTTEELQNAKTYIAGSFPLNLDSNGKIARFLLMVQLRGLGLDYLEKRNSYIEAVTLEDVRRVAKSVLDPEKLVFVVVGSPGKRPNDG
jgi:zinc protease